MLKDIKEKLISLGNVAVEAIHAATELVEYAEKLEADNLLLITQAREAAATKSLLEQEVQLLLKANRGLGDTITILEKKTTPTQNNKKYIRKIKDLRSINEELKIKHQVEIDRLYEQQFSLASEMGELRIKINKQEVFYNVLLDKFPKTHRSVLNSIANNKTRPTKAASAVTIKKKQSSVPTVNFGIPGATSEMQSEGGIQSILQHNFGNSSFR